MSTTLARPAVRRWVGLPARALVALVELYRVWWSPTRPPSCRFTPTCSEYAVDALRERGAVVGLGLTVVRVAKCAPWHPGGWDPVPPRRTSTGDDEPRSGDADELRSE